MAAALLSACSAPDAPARSTPEAPTSSTVDAPAFEELLRELEGRYSASRVEGTLEALPVLGSYLDEPDGTRGSAAAERHYEGLLAQARSSFASRVRWTFVYQELFRLLGADLPNGIHDVAYALPESRSLYEGVLDTYGIEPGEFTPYLIASSLSTADDEGLIVRLAWYVAGLPEAERADYLQRFLDRAREMRSADAP